MTRQYDRFAGPIAFGWLNETTGFGLAWWISERNGAKIFAHSGSVLSNGNQAHPFLYQLALKALDALEPELK
jgi:hypothetical protein